MSESKAVENMHNMVQYWTSIQPVQKSKRTRTDIIHNTQNTQPRRKVKIKRSLPKTQDVSHTTVTDCSKF